MKFGFFTLGCKVNRFETQALEQLAVKRGHEIVGRDADAFIINTCTVTAVSDHKNLRAVHKIRRENPDAVIAAIGCLAQMNPDKLLAGGEVDVVCGTSHRASVIEQCEQAVQNRPVKALHPAPPSRVFESLPAGVPAGRTRALLKIQDGCDNYCAYCIIPYARGHVRSLPPDDVREQIRALAEDGVKEIVLTGIEISSYGRDFTEEYRLIDLLVEICIAVPEVRIRLSSLEPRTISEEFCRRLCGFDHLARHFHLSLQSGCDSVLARMNRRYSTALFRENIALLRAYFPGCSITTDLIVGFPGETEEEFQETLHFIRQCQFSSIHVFPYSPRAGTPAATMPGQIPETVKARRAGLAKQAASETEQAYLESFQGKPLQILLEHPVSDNVWSGHSSYHFPVLVHTENGAKNRTMTVVISRLEQDGLHGAEQ